jgi:6-pyruvoyltetrahydropterin/6-carboxytetrahydropterin synthase
MLITKEIEIDMGHRVTNHNGKCRNIHGHRYKFEVGVDDKICHEAGYSDEGMVIDFSDLKYVMMQVIDTQLDHGFMMFEDDGLKPIFEKWADNMNMKIIFVPFIPTAENIAKYIFEQMDARLKAIKINLEHVKVWETPTSTAIYTRRDSNESG